MSDNLLIKEENFEEVINSLTAAGVLISDLENKGFILPIEVTETEEVFNRFTSDIRNHFLDQELQVRVIRSKDKVVKYQVLNAADVILPTLIFVGNFALSVGAGVLGNYLYSEYFESAARVKADILHLKTDNFDCKRYSIEGSAEDVIKILESLSGKEGV